MDLVVLAALVLLFMKTSASVPVAITLTVVGIAQSFELVVNTDHLRGTGPVEHRRAVANPACGVEHTPPDDIPLG